MLGKRNRFTTKKLMEHGTAAPATVLEISERGMTVTNGSEGLISNTEVILKTRLRVEPAGQPAFEVHQKFRYPQLDIPSVGSVLSVRFDPDDHDKLLIDRSAIPQLAGRAGAGLKDLGSVLSTVQQARANSDGDINAVAEALRNSFGAQGITVVDAAGMGVAGGTQGSRSPEEARIANLERLVALRDSGALTEEEFAAQKASLLAEPS